MARLYREHVLGEKPKEGFIPLDTLIAPAPKPAPDRRTGHGRLVFRCYMSTERLPTMAAFFVLQ